MCRARDPTRRPEPSARVAVAPRQLQVGLLAARRDLVDFSRFQRGQRKSIGVSTPAAARAGSVAAKGAPFRLHGGSRARGSGGEVDRPAAGSGRVRQVRLQRAAPL